MINTLKILKADLTKAESWLKDCVEEMDNLPAGTLSTRFNELCERIHAFEKVIEFYEGRVISKG